MKNFFIPILTIAILFGGIGATQAFGHADPNSTAPGVASSIPVFEEGTNNPVTVVSTGDVVDIVLTISKQAPGNPAIDGGTIAITTPDGTTTTNMPAGPIVPCVGGTTDTGDLIGPADCVAALASFTSPIVQYTVDCSVATDTDQNAATPNVIVFTGAYNGFSHRNAGDTLLASASPQNEIECVEDFTFVTSATPKGTTTPPVINPSDLVTITGVNGISGDFTTSAMLTGPAGEGLPTAAVCVISPTTTSAFDLVVTCTVTDTFDTPGQYCWNVTVNETGVNYSSSSDGEQFGINDAANECFEIVEEDYTFVTSATPKGTAPSGGVTNPSDLVTITGVGGVSGDFTTSAMLTGPAGEGLPTAAVCVISPTTTSVFDLLVTCTVIGTFNTPGTYCWDVTVNETGPNYFAGSDGEQLGTADAANECFVIEPRVPEFEYFVGGGKILLEAGEKQKDNVYLTHGFQLHCDVLSGPNNLEVNWDSGDGRFHLEQLVATECVDDDSMNEPPPSPATKDHGPGPTTDVYYGEGFGRYNGECGAFAQWVFDDNGEPGKNDHIVAMIIKDSDGIVVLDLGTDINTRDTSTAEDDNDPWFDLITGNHQWVPHPTPTHGPTGTQPCDPQ